MTGKEALESIIWRLTCKEEDLELRETAKKEIEVIRRELEENQRLSILLDDSRTQCLTALRQNYNLKKFAMHFKSSIEEGLSPDYRPGDNMPFDSIVSEFGRLFLRELLEVLNNG